MTISDLIMNDETKSFKSTKVMKLELDDIEVNQLNKAEMSDVEELAESIRVNGLIDPILVYKVRNNRYCLLGGERRYRAHRLLEKEDSQYSTINAVVIEKPEALIEERLMIVLDNAQREQTRGYVKTMVNELSELYDLKKIRGGIQDRDVEGVRKTDWIAHNIGFKISPRTVQEYLTGEYAKGEEEQKEQKKASPLTMKKLSKILQKALKHCEEFEPEADYAYVDLVNLSEDCSEMFIVMNQMSAALSKLKSEASVKATKEKSRVEILRENEEQLTIDGVGEDHEED